jgi:hypothetical protein
MEIATGEHHAPPLSPTLFHFFPHEGKIRPPIGKCQEKKAQKRKKFPLKNLLWVLGCSERRETGIVDPYFRDLGKAAGVAAAAKRVLPPGFIICPLD